MNRNHLALFFAVAEEGSFSRGAQRLRISQPAVSKQVSEFEGALGVKLFDRLPKGVRLTDAGEMLATYARRMFALEQEAERALAELHGLERGRLAVGASTTIGIYLLPELFGEFRRRYPKIELTLEIANTEVIQNMLIDGVLDLGMTEGFVRNDDLESEVFYQDELCAIAPPNHPLAKRGEAPAEEFCREPLVLREHGSGTRDVVEQALAGKGLYPKPTMSLGSTEAVKRAVAAGIGVSVVSRLTIQQELQLKRLKTVKLTDLQILRPLHKLHRRGRNQSRIVIEFEVMLKDHLAQRAADVTAETSVEKKAAKGK